MARFRDAGGAAVASVAAAVGDAEIVVTMLPEGRQVRAVYLDQAGVFAAANPSALLVDCSTIDVETSRTVARRRVRAVSPCSTRRSPAAWPGPRPAR